MNMQKLTQKSLEAIQKAQNIAIENQNAEILPEHIAYALTDDDGGLVPSLIRKCGGNPDAVAAALDDSAAARTSLIKYTCRYPRTKSWRKRKNTPITQKTNT